MIGLAAALVYLLHGSSGSSGLEPADSIRLRALKHRFYKSFSISPFFRFTSGSPPFRGGKCAC